MAPGSAGDLVNLILALSILVIIIGFIKALRYTEPVANWHHTFDGLQLSVDDFLNNVQAAIEKRELPKVHVARRHYLQKGILSKRRVYLEVSRGDYVFHVGAGPFGNAFFFSWWMRQRLTLWQQFLAYSRFLRSRFAHRMRYKPYHQLDLATTFRQIVHHVIIEVIDEMTETKVERLTELERQPSVVNILE